MKRLARSTIWSEKKIDARVRSGYGQGTLASYLPWIGIRDLSSMGTSTRMWSPKTGRMMQFLSNVERDAFLVAEYREDFVDYWEQWPLDRRLTAWAAEHLGFRHPQYIGTTLPVVMTVDAVLTLKRGDGTVRKAVDCKHSSDLPSVRVREKLAITQAACRRQGLPHMVVTEKTHDQQQVKNILWVRIAVKKSGEVEPVHGAFDMWPMRMLRHLMANADKPAHADLSLSEYCKRFESENSLPTGMGLRCLKLLMWQHLVEFDLSSPAPEKLRVRELELRTAHAVLAKPQPESV
jgi:hypothetical protein